MMYSLQNRRYIGNKYKLLPFIESVLESIEFNSIADLFAGTGVVSEYFMSEGKKAIINDNLYSNYIFYVAWLSNWEYDAHKIQMYLDYFNNSVDFLVDNYFSDTFAGTYFSYNDAKKIGSIREYLEKIKNEISAREYAILLASVLYTADKIANTVGHFEAYLSKPPVDKGVVLQNLNICQYNIMPEIYQQDANVLAKSIDTDVLYLDPPYNARQYINFYHILENLAEWKKPEVFGKTQKMKRDGKKSVYSQAGAADALADIVQSVKAKYILLSYNNTYNARSGASINKISEENIEEILQSVGQVTKFEQMYRFFNSGKTDFKNHKEILYLCRL